MLQDVIKNYVKTYLKTAAKNAEDLCKEYDAARTKSEVQASITALEALLEKTTSEKAKTPIQESINKLKASDKKLTAVTESKAIEAFVLYGKSGDLYCLIPLPERALQYKTGQEILANIEEVAKTYGGHVKKIGDSVLFTISAVKQKEFLSDAFKGKESSAIRFYQMSLYDIFMSAAKGEKVSAAKEKDVAKEDEAAIAKTMQKEEAKKKAGSIEDFVESCMELLTEGDRGYFTIPELTKILNKSESTVYSHIGDGLLKTTKRKNPGRKGKVLTVSYDEVIKYKRKYFPKFDCDNQELVAAATKDIKAKHSDDYLKAVYNMSDAQLDALKNGANGQTKKADKAKNVQIGDEVRQFFRKHGTDAAAFEEAKKKFDLPGRTLHGYRMSIRSEKK